jgi:serine/threonine-protein kinase
MSITEPFVLPPDVSIVAVSQLPPALREQLPCGPDCFAITRHGSRTASSVVDGPTARLLERFRMPVTIVDAILAFSGAEDLDPRQTLEETFPVLGEMITDGVLVTAGSDLAEPIVTTLHRGERLGDLEIIEAVHVVVDTEVYRARRRDGPHAALKLARRGYEERMRGVLAHEAAILRSLDDKVNPAVVAEGEQAGRPWLALTWCAGVDAVDAAAEHRATGEWAALLQLIERILEAFAHLHEQSVLHGDVHPRNVLVDAFGAVTIIDYGLSAAPGVPAIATGGVDLFLAPETAVARLEGRVPPPLTPASEQYALGALAYLLLTGTHTHAFSLERDVMLRQLRDEPHLPFDRVGLHGLDAVEGSLRRALAKDPAARFASVGELLDDLRSAWARALAPRLSWTRPAGRGLIDGVLVRLTAPGELLAAGVPAPTASVANGAAGFAYALLRIASIRGNAHLLASADLWAERAVGWMGAPDAFVSGELDLVRETVGERSFYHHEAGVYCVQALVAGARDDSFARRRAVDEFVRAARRPCPDLDVAFGRAGLLLGCTHLWESLREVGSAEEFATLKSIGDYLSASIAVEIDRAPPIAHGRSLTRLGAAHGWAGWLYALLRWAAASGGSPPEGIPERLAQLAALGRPVGRAVHWPLDSRAVVTDGALTSSWCNGAAGCVPLWTIAHTLLRDERYLDLAAAAAWAAYGGQETAPGDICCGLAGRAYSLAAMHRHTGDDQWLARARLLGDRAVERIRDGPLRRDSLHKGEVGVALLLEELSAPTSAGLPLYEPEGWPAAWDLQNQPA